MAPFSVSQLKDKASNIKSSSSEKFHNTRDKFQSRSSAESSYDHRDLSTKAPPPPPRALAGQPQEINSLPLRPGPPPPVRRSTRPIANNMPPQSQTSQNISPAIKWSSLGNDDKRIFFEWLDEFFNARGQHSEPVEQNRSQVARETKNVRQPTDELNMSHPPHCERGSAAQDFCVFFSDAIHWDHPWFSSDIPVPPPLEQIRDCIRTHSIQWLGDTRTLCGGVLFSDLSACWYTVEWTTHTAHDTSRARRSVAFTPRPSALSQAELTTAHDTYGETVASFVEGYEGTGQWIARGECWDAASEALRTFEQWSYVPKPIPSIGKTHGHLIFEGKAWGKNAQTQQAGRWRGGDERIRRGDIVQWKTVTILEGYSTFTLGDPDHTAIIVKDQQPLSQPMDGHPLRPAELGSLEVVEQSVHSPPSRKAYKLIGMVAGELWIYRPIGMEAFLGFSFNERPPKGAQNS